MPKPKVSLAEKNPEVATQWHPTKNGDLTAHDVSPSSKDKAWWICEKNHEWDAAISNRMFGRGCPICSNKRIVFGINDLETLEPVIAKEWHPTKNTQSPRQVAPGSGKKVWWVCQEGHEWQSTVQKRTLGGGCPVCSGNVVLSGFNDLATLAPDVARQWHPVKNGDLAPNQVTRGSRIQVWWVCELEHEWKASVSDRTRKDGGRGCPVCSGAKLLVGFNDLATKRPDLVSQWHSAKNSTKQPHHFSPSSTEEVWWKCSEGHEWKARISYRNKSKPYSCPACSGKLVIAGINDVATTHPEVLTRWNFTKNKDIQPKELSWGSTSKNIWWTCDKGHERHSSVRSMVAGTCYICSGLSPHRGVNDLYTTHPEIASQWHPTKNGDKTPADVSYGSDAGVTWWLCEEGHEWKASVWTRTRGIGCPYCSGRFPIVGVNDLATTHPELLTQWHPTKNENISPQEVKKGSAVQVYWLCPKGHEWKTYVYNRTLAKSGCPNCVYANGASEMETDLAAHIEMLGVRVERNVRGLLSNNRIEVDIFLPDFDLAIEFNGLYWHSEASGRDKHYHKRKHQESKEAGILLYQVWEDDWRDRKPLVLRGIAHRIGKTKELRSAFPDMPRLWSSSIGARKTRVVKPSHSDASLFLEENHIQGKVEGARYLGLEDEEGNLRAVFAYKKSGALEGEWYIERYATAGTVPGGFTKLLKFAEKNNPQIDKWITFADHSISDGGLYEKNGFVLESELDPDYSYLLKGRMGTRAHKFNYRISRFKDDPALKWEDGLTERELAALNGLHRIWDSGKSRYVKEVLKNE